MIIITNKKFMKSKIIEKIFTITKYINKKSIIIYYVLIINTSNFIFFLLKLYHGDDINVKNIQKIIWYRI